MSTRTTVPSPAVSRPDLRRGAIWHGKLAFWTTAVTGTALDWWSKGAAFAYHLDVQGHVARDQPLRVLDLRFVTVDLVREFNSGMAFGLLQHTPSAPMFLALARCAALIALLAMLGRLRVAGMPLVALGLVAAGAAGNLADNLFHREPGHEHAVRDFLHVAGRGWQLPACNLADVFLTLGAATFVVLVGARRLHAASRGAMDDRAA